MERELWLVGMGGEMCDECAGKVYETVVGTAKGTRMDVEVHRVSGGGDSLLPSRSLHPLVDLHVCANIPHSIEALL